MNWTLKTFVFFRSGFHIKRLLSTRFTRWWEVKTRQKILAQKLFFYLFYSSKIYSVNIYILGVRYINWLFYSCIFFCYLCWGFSGIEEMSHVLCNCRLLDRAWLLESSWIHKYILHTFVSFTFFYIAKRHFLNTLRYPYGSWLGWAQKAICSCCRSAAEPRSNLTSTTTFVSIDMHIS